MLTDLCGWQLSGRLLFFFFSFWQTALVYSVPVVGMYFICNLCFVPLLLLTVRLSVSRSVQILTAVATVGFDSPAFYSTSFGSTPFHHLLFRSTFSFSDSVNCFLLHLNLGFLLRFFDRRFCWDRSSRPGSRWAAVDRGAVSTSGPVSYTHLTLPTRRTV